ncbi:MAG TPA: UDP-N-acetylglucosamine 2-epimerase (non-hydrolyzing) [Armatimonadota bacterium]|jgi:UDP-N-acetylglucosamine 2-epimerase (non-hydrolysing)
MQAAKLICVGGARPNFMKLAPLVRLLRGDDRFQTLLVNTGQHYDDQMSGQFFRDLGMPEPDYQMEVGSGSHAVQTGEIMKRFETIVQNEQPRAVLVVGDVNSTIACALVAAKLHVPVVHVEAGLRSFDRSMPEEINRLVTDVLSDLFLVTEESGAFNLRTEGAAEEKIAMVGNLMIDSLFFHLKRAEESDIARRCGLQENQSFGLVTLHRPANVDDAMQLAGIMEALREISQDLPLLFPVHPRTRSRLSRENVGEGDCIRLLDPLGYIDFLGLMRRAAVVLTDSGGIQEETTALGIPCLTIRDNTERPITVEQGTNILAGTCKKSILAAWEQIGRQPKQGRIPPLWDGRAAERCRDAVWQMLEKHGVR